MSVTISLKVWGELALFTRPELKVERLSYPIMTPSAARGILDAILFRPQMRWHVRRITALEPDFPEGVNEDARRKPYRLISVRRNEINDKISSRTVDGWIKEPRSFSPYLVDSAGRDGVQGANRAQRNSLILSHVAYLIQASPELTSKANQPREVAAASDEDQGPDTEIKYAEMFQRRARKGQCFHHPYLGCREFPCHFCEPDGTEKPLVNWSEPLGLMLYDIRFAKNGANRPGFFESRVREGVLHCDTEGPGPKGEPPITVFGWDD
jgi:CRISPR-associated protein Cas5d